MSRYFRRAGIGVVRPTPGALVVLLGTSGGDGSGGRCWERKAGDGRRLLPAACKLPKTMTHDEGSLADFLVDAVEPRVGNAASFGYGGYSSGSVPSGLARSSR